MHEDDDNLPSLPGYMTVKQAAGMLGLADRTIYEFVQEGRLPGHRIGNVIAISIEEVQKFKRSPAGRPRVNPPAWRISSGENTQFMTFVFVQIRPGKLNAFTQKLETIRKNGLYKFPGTVARYIMGDDQEPGRIQITLVWRGTVMPDDETREMYLAGLGDELQDVVDWQTAEYHHGQVFIHT